MFTFATAVAPTPPFVGVITTVGILVYPVPSLVTRIPCTPSVTEPPVMYLTKRVSGSPASVSLATLPITSALVPD